MALIPPMVVTGVLGVGKATLLNKLLRGSHGKPCAVIVNEHGELGIDADLVVGARAHVHRGPNAGPHGTGVAGVGLSFARSFEHSRFVPWFKRLVLEPGVEVTP